MTAAAPARLWVTGLGLVTPLGRGVEPTWSRLVRGDRAMAPLALFDASAQRVAIAAEVPGVVVPDEPRGAWSRTSAMAFEAAEEAMRAARIDAHALRVGLVIGGTTAGMLETERLLAAFHAEPGRREAVVEMRSHPLTSTGDLLDERLGPFVRVRTVSSACSAGANAVAIAAAWLRSGEVDAVVAGGADGLCRLTITGFNALGAIDPEPCRPFDRRRRGTTLGEGAGFLVLERAGDAGRRGAEPIAELAGWALGAEAHHITNPAADGAVVGQLVRRALARAGLRPSDVDYVNAHGTGTPANDAMESAALAIGLGEELPRIPVSSSKGQIGHTLGAAGAIEAAVTALVVARRHLVPTAGLDEPDPALPLAHVPHVGRPVARVRAALSNAFGFGGMSAVLAFTEPERAGATTVTASGRGSATASSTEGAAVVTGVAAWTSRGPMGAAGCADLPSSSAAGMSGPSGGDPADESALLDPGRARRLDRMARLGTVVVEHALREAGAAAGDSGVVLGNAYGNVDACAAFMHRAADKGPRAASPAEFPNLVPSSPVGHVSIYAGAHGPTFATSDLGTSGSAAFAQAVQLVVDGDAQRVVAGASEPRSEIVDRVLSDLFSVAPRPAGTARVDLAAALVVEDAASAEARGARPLARVAQVLEWRASPDAALAALAPPRSTDPEVVVARADDPALSLVDATSWRGARRAVVAPSIGESDALCAAALAVGAARIGAGRAAEVLVVTVARSRGYAFVLVRA